MGASQFAEQRAYFPSPDGRACLRTLLFYRTIAVRANRHILGVWKGIFEFRELGGGDISLLIGLRLG